MRIVDRPELHLGVRPGPIDAELLRGDVSQMGGVGEPGAHGVEAALAVARHHHVKVAPLPRRASDGYLEEDGVAGHHGVGLAHIVVQQGLEEKDGY